MLTIVYSTHKSLEYNEKFKEHLNKSVGVENVQILEYINNNQYSLSQIYNKGIKKSVNDIIVCLHNDVKLSKGWGKKLLSDFKENTEYGIIGKAGSTFFPESGIYWENMNQTMVGQVYHHPPGNNKYLSHYSPKLNYLIPVVTIDGLFISFDKTKIKHTFDESIGKFHFYDHPFSLSNFLDGVKIGVTSSFEITHESIGKPNNEFFESKDVFLKKFKEKLPIIILPEKVHINPISEYKNKKKNKVAIIIPTKGNLNFLFDCVESFFEHCNPNHFNIFIADTGSSEEEKNNMKNKFSCYSNIKIIEYDYYNFAKINNDVVKNHISNDFNFLLFSNNDVKLLSNVIDSMLMTFEENINVGTVGARLYFEDNTIQHDGIRLGYILEKDRQKGRLSLSHYGLNSTYNFINKKRKVVGNTAALMMIRKNTFEKIGMFNENYIDCFEDVELNFKCVIAGFNNYLDCNSVAYHYESKTRNNDPDKNNKVKKDYLETLFPFIDKNLEKLRDYVVVI
jgi:GT2 family glycosyltransferase